MAIFGPLLSDFEHLGKWLDDHEPEMSADVLAFAHATETAAQIILPLLAKVLEGWRLIFQLGRQIADSKQQSFWDTWFPTSPMNPRVFGWLLDKLGIKDVVDQALGQPQPITRSPGEGFGLSLHNPGNLKYAGQAGAIRAGGSPAQRQFAAFRTDEEGLGALARQLERYYHRGRTSIESVLSQYAPAGDNDLPAYIADVSARMHRAATASLNLDDPAVLAAMMNAIIRHEQNANPYSPALVRSAAESAVRGGGGTLNQTVNVRIDGSKDPAVTKKIVLETFSELNQQAVRALQPTTQ